MKQISALVQEGEINALGIKIFICEWRTDTFERIHNCNIISKE